MFFSMFWPLILVPIPKEKIFDCSGFFAIRLRVFVAM